MEKLVIGQVQQAKTYGICFVSSHPTNMCPILQDDSKEYTNAFREFPIPH